MKQQRTFPRAVVTKKQELSIKNGHPWIYADEITECSENIENGSFIDVFGHRQNYLGTGFWSADSLIRIRLLDNNANEKFDDAFFERRVRYALQYRDDIMKDQSRCIRLIHGEADGLPGLTVDRYNDILVSEVLSYGMEQHKDVIYRALVSQLEGINGIYERNEGELRKKEGLSQYKGWYDIAGKKHPESCLTIIDEEGVQYEVDVENGQKTGFFLDQKYNRLAVRRLAEGRKVLDCCTHTGSFAINAAIGNAEKVTAVDVSEYALKLAEENARRNQVAEKIDFVQADIMEYLPQQLEAHADFDFIILDPPAFTKSRKTFEHAKNGYEKINTLAMRLLPRGGYLATASCSHFMPTSEFRKMLQQAGKEAGRTVRIVEERHASPDHPVIVSIPETDYLKFFILQIL